MAVGAQGPGGGLGMLAALGGGGGQGPDSGTAPSADDLLAQIKDLLQQYLALGPDTPVAAEAQALSDAIDSNSGQGAAPEGSAPEEAAESPAQEKAEIAGGEAPDADDTGKYSSDGFKRARPGAKAFLKSKNKKAKA